MKRSCLRLALLAAALAAGAASAQPPVLLAAGPSWQELSPAEQQALRPLQRDWATADEDSKRQWLGVAARFDRMSPAERARVQQRMDDWARLSPRQRAAARSNFREAQTLSPTERRERWDAYRALSDEQRRRLGDRTAPPTERRRPADAVKSNTVPNPLLEPRRGATTPAPTGRPAPPLHQQPGLPKVNATPEFVDPSTLLPKRGAQGAGAERPERGGRPPQQPPGRGK